MPGDWSLALGQINAVYDYVYGYVYGYVCGYGVGYDKGYVYGDDVGPVVID